MQSKKKGGGGGRSCHHLSAYLLRHLRDYVPPSPVADQFPHSTIQGLCSRLLSQLAASDLRPTRLDLNESVKHRTHQHLSSVAVSEGWVKPPQGFVLHQALTLASDSQLLQDQKTSLLIKTIVTTQLLRKMEHLHWLPWQTLIFAGCSV